METISSERHDAIVIGAGQAGLAAAYHLAKRGIDFVVLEANDRVVDNWRSRYDSLRLYSPAKYDGLPGLRFPLQGHRFPTGREMGDYLESYVRHFELPVRTATHVDGLRDADGQDGYVVTGGQPAIRSRAGGRGSGLFPRAARTAVCR